VRTIKDAFADQHTIEREMVLKDAQNHFHIGAPIKFRAEPAQPVLFTPAYGEHSHAIAMQAGLSAEEAAQLQMSSVI
jgi:crotonobetainyl-CoA:carnitine CoA-transferase CaiB-like acyl-CoA transferase